jgi:hypothetical protein
MNPEKIKCNMTREQYVDFVMKYEDILNAFPVLDEIFRRFTYGLQDPPIETVADPEGK